MKLNKIFPSISSKRIFQYASDLHLEVWPKSKPFQQFIKLTKNSKDTYLLLAGDITAFNCRRTEPFLKWCSENFKKVFWVSGNHEYYMRGKYTIDEGIEMKKEICEYVGENVIPLDDEVYEIDDDIVIIGSTMWCDIPLSIAEEVSRRINDYRQIKDFTVEYQNELHHKSLKFIQKSLEKYKDKTKIVVTHHAPSEYNTIGERWRGSSLNPVFATDVEYLVKQADYWVFGHTHHCADFKIEGCRVMSNAKGYSDLQGESYDGDKSFSIKN